MEKKLIKSECYYLSPVEALMKIYELKKIREPKTKQISELKRVS